MKKFFLFAAALMAAVAVNAAAVTIHYVNVAGWEGTPLCVCHGGGEWGWDNTLYAPMTAENEQINGYDVYGFTIDPDTTAFTGDLSGFQFCSEDKANWAAASESTFEAANGKYWYNDAWYNREDIPGGEVETHYYIIGEGADCWNDPETGKSWSTFVLMENDEVHIDAPANSTLTFQVYTDTSWGGGMGYSNIDMECSSEGIEAGSGNNITVTLTDGNGMTVKVVEGYLCITGSFGQAVIETYTVVGSSAEIFGTAWAECLATNDMTFNAEESVWELEKNGVTLSADVTLEYRVVGNHGWSFQFPDENQTATLTAGTSDFLFVFDATANTLNVYQYEATALEQTEAEAAATKRIVNGQIVILKNGVRYNALGSIIL